MVLGRDNLSNYKEWQDLIFQEGATLLIDKEVIWTSFDVIAKLRNIFKIKKIGHAGTLDPFASGLLIVCLGKHTKQINQYQDMPKAYAGTARLGARTISDDAEHPEFDYKNIDEVTIESLQLSANELTGSVMQTPPVFSAKKIKGKRLYDLSRKNIESNPEPVNVEISKLEITDYYKPFFEFHVECSKGTYIRSIARDIGNLTGKGAYLFKLRRTAIGGLNVDNAVTIKELLNLNRQNQ